MNDVRIEVTPTRVTKFFSAVVCFLVSIHIAGKVSAIVFGHAYWRCLIPLFDLDLENNVPSAYSAGALLFSAILLGVVAAAEAKRERRGHVRFWVFLALIFLFLSADELLELHEQLVEPIRASLNTSGILYFAWVIPYGIGVIVLGGFCLRFLMTLPREIGLEMAAAGAVYVGGAIGMELIGGLVAEPLQQPELDPLYALVIILEESLEMGGVVIFIHALLSYLALLGVRIDFKR